MPTTTPLPGCYFDSHRGHYITPAIIELAETFGRKLDPHMESLLSRYDAECHEPGYPYDEVVEESDAAIQWLNDHCPLSGHYWDWYEGDFGLYPLWA